MILDLGDLSNRPEQNKGYLRSNITPFIIRRSLLLSNLISILINFFHFHAPNYGQINRKMDMLVSIKCRFFFIIYIYYRNITYDRPTEKFINQSNVKTLNKANDKSTQQQKDQLLDKPTDQPNDLSIYQLNDQQNDQLTEII